MQQMVFLLLTSILLSTCSNAQIKHEPELLGSCEGCEAVFEYGDSMLFPVDTLPDFEKDGMRIKVSGTVYKSNGKTPARDVILYIYHTNQEGLYVPKENAKGWGKRHGYIRTWLKTDKNGYYAFYTLKPAPYPNRTDPAHIHYIILEPNGKYYWLGSCHFQGDSLLTENEIHPDQPRGGSSGLVDLKKEGTLMVGTRDIILGKNIPGYE